ncbi:hypothetical protein GBAR_LOCUS10358, partial [Geodia barretti]
MQQWRHSFVDLSLIWMEVLGKQINKWVLSAVAKDKWTLLHLCGPVATSRTDTGGGSFPAHPVTTTAVIPGISASPFPSPGFTPKPNTPQASVGSIGSRGAFMPYRKPSGEKRRGGKESNSRSSSSRLVSPTDNAVRAVAEIPDLVIRGAHRSTPTLGPSPQDNIMKFWQAGRLQDYQRRGELEHSSTVEPAAEIEVCVSVYGSRDASPTNQPSPSSPPQVTQSNSDNPHRQQSSTQQEQPPPLLNPAPRMPETGDIDIGNEGVRESVGGEGGRDSQPDGREVDTRFEAVGTPGLVINSAAEDQDPVADTTTSRTSAGNESRPVLAMDQGDKELAGKREDDQFPSPARSDYRTPSPISDQHLRELSSSTTDNPVNRTPGEEDPQSEVVTGEGDRGGDEGEEDDDGEEAPDGIVFQPQSFPSAEPTTTTIGSREDEGGAVKPKPRPVRSGEPVIAGEDNKPRVTSAFTRLSPSREPVFVEDGSTVSSVASSFRDTSSHLRKDFSSLSLDRHSDMEESSFQIDGGQQRGRGGAGDSGRHVHGEGTRWGGVGGEGSAYLLPVSNSPVDLVTMLTRLAGFTSTLLATLTPKLRHGAVPGLDEPRRAHDYAPDVANAKRQASQQLKHVENTHAEFLKKLHKIMNNSLRLYADNLMCMDLCCWSNSEATQLLVSEVGRHPSVSYHTARARDFGNGELCELGSLFGG